MRWWCDCQSTNGFAILAFSTQSYYSHSLVRKLPTLFQNDFQIERSLGRAVAQALKQTCTAFIDWLIHIYSIVVTSFNPMIISGQASPQYITKTTTTTA